MAQRRQNGSSPIKVCVIGRESLGTQYLHHLLKGDAELRLFQQEDANSTAAFGDGTRAVFLLDAGELNLSLSRHARSLRARFPEANILALSPQLPVEEQCRLILGGVDGIVPYDEVAQRLRQVIRAVVQGQSCVSPDVLTRYVNFSRSAQSLWDSDFTEREQEVLGLVRRRLLNKGIADKLNISESTVKFHLSNIYTKLGVRDRYAAVEASSSAERGTPTQPVERESRLVVFPEGAAVKGKTN